MENRIEQLLEKILEEPSVLEKAIRDLHPHAVRALENRLEEERPKPSH